MMLFLFRPIDSGLPAVNTGALAEVRLCVSVLRNILNVLQ